jgi:hypothetical protein
MPSADAFTDTVAGFRVILGSSAQRRSDGKGWFSARGTRECQ